MFEKAVVRSMLVIEQMESGTPSDGSEPSTSVVRKKFYGNAKTTDNKLVFFVIIIDTTTNPSQKCLHEQLL